MLIIKKINIIHTNRDSNKLKLNKKQNITKFNINNSAIKQKSAKTNDKNNNNTNILYTPQREKKVLKKDSNAKNEDDKKNKNEKNKDNIDENNEKTNLVKYREKKVHYEKQRDKFNKNNIKQNYNSKGPIKPKEKNILKNSFLNSNKNDINKNRIKSAIVDRPLDKKRTKDKNDIKNSANFEMIHNSNAKSKKNIKPKISIIVELENKDKGDKKEKEKEKLKKLKTYNTPVKSFNVTNKLTQRSKVVKPLDKKHTYELSERISKKAKIYNRTARQSKTNKDILFLKDSKKKRKNMRMNIIYEKIDLNQIEDKRKSFQVNTNVNNISVDRYNRYLEKHAPEIKQIKRFSSYNSKKQNNKLAKNNDEKIIQNKHTFNKQKNLHSLDLENNDALKESFSKIDEDSIIISNKNLNCYEPFDLNLAYLKTRKTLKEELIKLFDKYKVKYRHISNTRFMVELKKEDVALGIKFDKLNFINDDNEKTNNNNNQRISIIKLRRLKGSYQSNLKAFEKVIYKLN